MGVVVHVVVGRQLSELPRILFFIILIRKLPTTIGYIIVVNSTQ